MTNNDYVGFLTNAEFAEEFFKRCGELKEDTRDSRTALWQEMVRELKAISMTKQDLTRYMKNKRILQIKKRPE